MKSRSSRDLREISPLLLPNENRAFYRNKSLLIIQLYFFTGFLANFPVIVHGNNVIAALCILMLLFGKGKRGAFSPVIILYGSITLLSVINHLIWWYWADFPAEARTMPITLLMMISVRVFAVEGLFARGVALNALPFILLYSIGAHFERGRFYSLFLDENVHGQALIFAYAIGLTGIVNQQYNFLYITSFAASLLHVLLGASRKLFLFFVLGLTSAMLTLRRRKASHILSMLVIASMAYFLLLPLLVDRQKERFGEDVKLESMIERFITGGDDLDRSSQERRELIELSFFAAEQNWLGYGNGNFNYVVRTYGPHLPEAGHPHSGLAEALVTAGYPGALLYLLMLLYLFRIGLRDPIFRIILIWLFMQIFSETTLNNRIMWPLLVLAEWELTKNSAGRRAG